MPDSTSYIDQLREQMRGPVVKRGDAGYDDARAVWNGRFDRHPAAIARCSDVADVIAAVNIARDNGILVAVRSGGHDYSGNSVCDGGLVIDLSAMNGVVIDPDSKTARIQPGARWGEFDQRAQEFGLATTGGTVSTVGVAGYTLGGGTGWLSRKHGLGLDNLISVEIVTADGAILRASESENEDLFWALRGGSGNFGIVTSFEYRLHKVGPEVLAGQIIHRFEAAGEVLRFYRSLMAEAPDELLCYAFFFRLPPVEFIPQEFHGKVVIDLVVAYMGATSEGEKVLAPVRALGKPLVDGVAPQPYLELQKSFDAGMPAGNRWYSKAHYLPELSDVAIAIVLERVKDLPGEFSVVYFEPGGGAIRRIPAGATAFPHRDAAFGLHIFPGWTDPSDDEEMRRWALAFHSDLAPHSTGGVYVNLLGGDEANPARSAYGDNLARLAQIKKKYDPDNFFRMNHNVEPAAR